MKEFWSEVVTAKSWAQLVVLSKEYKFILIGGWAAYLWTRTHKSKDIDIVVDYDALHKIKTTLPLEKNERLRKYEVKMGEFDIDIYLPGYSKLAIPLEKLTENMTNIEGINVPSAESLVLLKQGAEIARRGSIKGKKDLIDILTLLIRSGFSIGNYKKLAREFSLEHYVKELENEINLFNQKDSDYLGMNLNEFAKWKKKFLEEITQ